MMQPSHQLDSIPLIALEVPEGGDVAAQDSPLLSPGKWPRSEALQQRIKCISIAAFLLLLGLLFSLVVFYLNRTSSSISTRDDDHATLGTATCPLKWIPPKAPAFPQVNSYHNGTFLIKDDFDWMRNANLTNHTLLMEYIQAENKYAHQVIMNLSTGARIDENGASSLVEQIKGELKWQHQNGVESDLPFKEMWQMRWHVYFVYVADGRNTSINASATKTINNNTQMYPIYGRWKKMRANSSLHEELARYRQFYHKKEHVHNASEWLRSVTSLSSSSLNTQEDGLLIEILLDVNQFVNTSAPATPEPQYIQVGIFEVSPSERLLAYSLDRQGNEHFTLYIRNISTASELLFDGKGWPDTYYSLRWSLDDWVYFNQMDDLDIPRYAYRQCIPDAWNPSSLDQPASTGQLIGGSQPHCPNEWKPQLIYTEPDSSMTTEISETSDHRYLVIRATGQVTTELYLITASLVPATSNQSDSAQSQKPDLKPLFKRITGWQYEVEHHNGYFYVRSNLHAPNGQVWRLPVPTTSPPSFSFLGQNTPDVVPGAVLLWSESSTRYIDWLEMFEQHLVVWSWEQGRRQLLIYSLIENSANSSSPIVPRIVDFGATASTVYAVFSGTIKDDYDRWRYTYFSDTLVFSNTSFLQPYSTYEYHLNTGLIRVLNRPLVRWNMSSAVNLMEQRILVPSYDGQLIPMLLVHDRSIVSSDNSSRPIQARSVFADAYGAYGTMEQPHFEPYLFPIIQRGIIFAYIIPRGDGNMGANWYLHGKEKLKFNTFLDVRRCLMYLVREGWTRPGWIGFLGRSAGGLLAGSVTNWLGHVNFQETAVSNQTNKPDPNDGSTVLRYGNYTELMRREIIEMRNGSNPDNHLVRVIIAQVPYVDVIHDMTDASVSWTAYEWHEWGNPNDLNIFQAMLDYSPYEHSVSRAYPALLVTGGLKDTRVPYFEPTKWVAKLRTKKLNERNFCLNDTRNDSMTPLLLMIDAYGHFGGTGDALYTGEAYWISFLLSQLQSISND